MTEESKLAVTEVAAVSVTVQVPVPLHPLPLQPVNVEPPAGVAGSVTAVAGAKLARHAAPQEIPPGALVTVPTPEPARSTVRTIPLPLPTWFSKLGQIDGHSSLAGSLSGRMQTYLPAFWVKRPPVIFSAHVSVPLTSVIRKF